MLELVQVSTVGRTQMLGEAPLVDEGVDGGEEGGGSGARCPADRAFIADRERAGHIVVERKVRLQIV